jgi:hypothetical protein
VASVTVIGALAGISALASDGRTGLSSAPIPAIASTGIFAPMARLPPNPLVARSAKLGAAELELIPNAGSVPVPRSFLGFSLEYWRLSYFVNRSSELAGVLALVHPTGGGPGLLRIGGDSADHVYWKVATPSGFDDIHPQVDLLRRLGSLVRRARLRVILDLNLAAGLPQMAVAWARVARANLPRGSLAAYEIGNEPNLFHRQRFLWLAAPLASPRELRSTLRSYGVGNYETDFATYAAALGRQPGRVPVAGPAGPLANRAWITGVIENDRRWLGMVTAHFYPFARCQPPGSPRYPTVSRILGGRTATDIVDSVAPAAAAAHRAGLSFHLTEFNSVSCGGRRGVSNTFSTALWAPAALFDLIRAGVDGVNLHVRAAGINAPFVFVPQGIQARPLLYGLAAFTQTVGPDARLLRTRLHNQRGLKLSAWSVRIRGDILHVLLTNQGPRGARVTLQLPARAPLTIRRLMAPAANATTGVTLAGQSINAAARWSGYRVSTSVSRGARGYSVTLPGYSAALLSVPLASGTGSRPSPTRAK